MGGEAPHLPELGPDASPVHRGARRSARAAGNRASCTGPGRSRSARRARPPAGRRQPRGPATSPRTGELAQGSASIASPAISFARAGSPAVSWSSLARMRWVETRPGTCEIAPARATTTSSRPQPRPRRRVPVAVESAGGGDGNAPDREGADRAQLPHPVDACVGEEDDERRDHRRAHRELAPPPPSPPRLNRGREQPAESDEQREQPGEPKLCRLLQVEGVRIPHEVRGPVAAPIELERSRAYAVQGMRLESVRGRGPHLVARAAEAGEPDRAAGRGRRLLVLEVVPRGPERTVKRDGQQ